MPMHQLGQHGSGQAHVVLYGEPGRRHVVLYGKLGRRHDLHLSGVGPDLPSPLGGGMGASMPRRSPVKNCAEDSGLE